jgi:hypothetical protein
MARRKCARTAIPCHSNRAPVACLLGVRAVTSLAAPTSLAAAAAAAAWPLPRRRQRARTGAAGGNGKARTVGAPSFD